jgi:hypothetical protein
MKRSPTTQEIINRGLFFFWWPSQGIMPDAVYAWMGVGTGATAEKKRKKAGLWQRADRIRWKFAPIRDEKGELNMDFLMMLLRSLIAPPEPR